MIRSLFIGYHLRLLSAVAHLFNLLGRHRPMLAESARCVLNPFVGRSESQKVFKYILIIFEFDEVNTILM